MHATTLGPFLLICGMILCAVAQLGIGLHALSTNPLEALGCLFVPFYIYVYARKHDAGIRLMRVWYAGVAVFVVGAILAS